jgi:hypothetical protein
MEASGFLEDVPIPPGPMDTTDFLEEVLIYDSALGPTDFSGARCIFPFRSSAFHEPSCVGASARLRAYARTRLFTVPSPLGVTNHQDTNVHNHTYPKDQISIPALPNMQSVHRD